MRDLVPLALVLLGIGLAVLAVISRRVKNTHQVARGSVAVLAAPVFALAGCYLAFAVIDGDPDVWDFYSSAWWLPLAIAGLYALVVSPWHFRGREQRSRTSPSYLDEGVSERDRHRPRP